MKKRNENIEQKNICPYFEENFCCDCDKSIDSFSGDECFKSETFIDMAKSCPVCTKGILNPTFKKTMSCDKCNYEESL